MMQQPGVFTFNNTKMKRAGIAGGICEKQSILWDL